VMNREIKFRAWHNEGGMFIDWDEIRNRHSMQFIFNYGDIELQQFTGLKDKNGVDIYEGDIVTANGSKYVLDHDMSQARKHVGNIRDISHFENERFKFECKWNPTFSMFYFDGCEQIESDISQRYIEVIGNIYENKELLESEA